MDFVNKSLKWRYYIEELKIEGEIDMANSLIMVHRSGTQLEELQPFRKFLKILNSF